MSERSERGRFLVLDGVDGCGKSTQATLLVHALTRPGQAPPLHLREPGGTSLGERLRTLLLSRDHDVPPSVEALLFAAARRQMLEELVSPALAQGRDVVCERFNPSTFAYQAVAGGLPERDVLDLLERWCGAPAPDLTILLDLPVELAAARRRVAGDRIEDKGLAFQRRVARGFQRWAELDPATVVVDASGDVETVLARVLAHVPSVPAEARRG